MAEYLGLSTPGLVCSLGLDRETILRRALAGDTSGMVPLEGVLPDGLATPFGAVALPPEALSAPGAASRCEAMIFAAADQIAAEIEALRARVPAHRIGIVLGTSNSTMEEFTSSLDIIDMAAPACALKARLGLSGPAFCVSTACSSSAKAFASARRLVTGGVCDAVLVGGVDSMARVVVNGFHALESMSTELAAPLMQDRRGINLGEAAAIFILERNRGPVALLGVGESSDAYHLTAPHPDGLGAEASMRAALRDAHLAPSDIDYVNLHGTGTPYNDSMEALAVARVFGDAIPPCSSTKPMTGHTLGAAGALEIALCHLLLAHAPDRLLPHVAGGTFDPALPAIPLATTAPAPRPVRTILSNSFAFGGSNATIVVGTAPAGATAEALPLEDLLPHARPMILLSGYDPASFTETSLDAFVTPAPADVFFDHTLGGTPAWTALEYMAQTVACHVGLIRRAAGLGAAVGYVLGSRSISLPLAVFRAGVTYTVHCERLFADSSFGSFATSMRDPEGNVVASAALSFYQPTEDDCAAPAISAHTPTPPTA